eukprot:PRCOL_00000469-RA
MAGARMQAAPEGTSAALSEAVRTLYRAMGCGELETGVAKAATSMLGSMVGGYSVTPAVGAKALRALQDSAPDPDAFRGAYERLADRAGRNSGLDRYLVVLGRIAQDPQLKALLTTQAAAASPQRAAASSASAPIDSPSSFQTRSNGLYESDPEERLRLRANGAADRPSAAEPVAAAAAVAMDRRRPDAARTRADIAASRGGAARALDMGPAPGSGPKQALPLGSYDRSAQEAFILDDLLYALGGIDGVFVARKAERAGAFVLDSTADASLAALTARLLPLCADRVAVEAFAEQCLGTGGQSPIGGRMTAQALGAALRAVLRDFDLLLAQLESQARQGSLTLQSMWLWCEPSAAAMRTLAGVVYAAEQAPNSRGCAVLLDVLEIAAKREAGDSAGQQLILHLLQAAATPCLAALEAWIYRGDVEDPYDEFMMVSVDGVSPASMAQDGNSAYWTGRYRLRQEGVPNMLRPVAPMVLAAGKHINAAKDAGHKVDSAPQRQSGDAPLSYAPGNRALEERVMSAQRSAAVGLLAAVKANGELLARLRSLKHYFLLDRGDWLVHFLDLATSELQRPTAEVQESALQGLMTVAQHNSAAVDDPFAGAVQVALAPHSVAAQLSVLVGGEAPEEQAPVPRDVTPALDMLTLEYAAPFPLSLVLSRASVFKYQLLFRHLLACHHVQRELRAAWQAQQRARTAWEERGRLRMMACCAGLQRMLHFWRMYEHYVSFEVIEPTWADMEAALAAAPDADGAMAAHGAFLDRAMALTLLYRPALADALARLRAASLAFAAIAIAAAEDTEGGGAGGSGGAAVVAQLRALDAAFDREQRALLDRLRGVSQLEPHLAFLATRLQAQGIA